jgi:hypothetical protein
MAGHPRHPPYPVGVAELGGGLVAGLVVAAGLVAGAVVAGLVVAGLLLTRGGGRVVRGRADGGRLGGRLAGLARVPAGAGATLAGAGTGGGWDTGGRVTAGETLDDAGAGCCFTPGSGCTNEAGNISGPTTSQPPVNAAASAISAASHQRKVTRSTLDEARDVSRRPPCA